MSYLLLEGPLSMLEKMFAIHETVNTVRVIRSHVKAALFPIVGILFVNMTEQIMLMTIE